MIGTARRLDIRATTDLGPFVRGEAAVYFLDPPLLHSEGVTTHVIAVANEKARMVDVFPAHESGEIAEWIPVNEFTEGVDHVRALRGMGEGYEVVNADERA